MTGLRRYGSRTLGALVPLMSLMLSFSACTCTRRTDGDLRAVGTRPQQKVELAETIFDGGIKTGWSDMGWSQREITGPKEARVNFANYGGWILGHPGLKGKFGALVFRYKAPREYGDFLEVRVDSTQKNLYPRIIVRADQRADLADGWSEVLIPLRVLNPEGLVFDRIVFRAAKPVGPAWISIDKVGLTTATGADLAAVASGPPKDVVMTLTCTGKPAPINPLIYGIAYDARLDTKSTQQFELGATARRWGGNTMSRYNWELGNAWNTGLDWFYENVQFTDTPGFNYKTFFAEQKKHDFQTILTVPLLGWVAKDTTSVSYPVSKFGAQKATDASWRPDAGNGLTVDGKPIKPGPQTETSVAATPDFVKRWVEAIREGDQKSGSRSVQMYILDNEPMLWNSTHRDVHPDPVTYDELLDKTIRYGSAVRAADPDAVIAGPSLWGWPAYNFSAKDAVEGFSFKPDRMAHGDMPLLAWYLRKLKEYETKTNTHILDVVDVHFYPQAEGVFGDNGGVDAATSALRLRQTRGLWDPTYVDESYIGEPINLIPRLKKWIDENYPGRGIQIGEWNFGAETHMSGGLAVAEVLGRFGQYGVTSAFYWTYPPKNSPAFWAFRAFRNFDGKLGRFLDKSLTTDSTDFTSFYASIDESGTHIVAIALNLSPDRAAKPKIVMTGCGAVSGQKTYEFTGDPTGFKPRTANVVGGRIEVDQLPPYSMTVFDLKLDPKKP